MNYIVMDHKGIQQVVLSKILGGESQIIQPWLHQQQTMKWILFILSDICNLQILYFCRIRLVFVYKCQFYYNNMTFSIKLSYWMSLLKRKDYVIFKWQAIVFCIKHYFRTHLKWIIFYYSELIFSGVYIWKGHWKKNICSLANCTNAS